MIIADTSGLIPYFNDADPDHEAVMDWFGRRTPRMVVSPFVVAEIDYLLATREGVESELVVLEELSSGAYELPSFTAQDLMVATAIVGRFRELGIGIAVPPWWCWPTAIGQRPS